MFPEATRSAQIEKVSERLRKTFAQTRSGMRCFSSFIIFVVVVVVVDMQSKFIRFKSPEIISVAAKPGEQ